MDISLGATLLHVMKPNLDDVRCPHCRKLLARGQAVEMEFKCPRCGTFFVLRAMSPSSEPLDGHTEIMNVKGWQSV